MRRAIHWILLSLLATAAGPALADTPATPAVSTPTAAESTVKVERLAWMAGLWRGEDQGVVIEEYWMAPLGGLMPGLHRDANTAKRKAFFEYLRIEEGPEGLVYQASPKGAPPTPFKLKSIEDREVVFEYLENDFPQRILYWIDEDGWLNARIEGSMGGTERSLQWRWQRVE